MGHNEKVREVQKKEGGFPDKKDFWYSITILVLIISGLTAFYFGGEGSNMVSHVGFAGTIVSILLAVIAIIYSFYQSSTYESATYKLDTSAQKIEVATNQLSNVSEVEEIMGEFKSDVIIIKRSIDDMKGMVHEGFSSFKDDFERMAWEDRKSNPNRNDDDVRVDLTEKYFQSVLQNTLSNNLFIILVVVRLSPLNISVVLKDWINIYVKTKSLALKNSEGALTFYVNVSTGALMAFSDVGFFNADFSNVSDELSFNISNVHPNLVKATNTLIEKICYEDKDEDFIKMLDELENFISSKK